MIKQSVMKLISMFGVLLMGLWTCVGNSDDTDCCTQCNQIVTVKDMSGGLDGCGMVLEQEDGTYLLPEKRIYVKAPEREEDPLYYFELKAGQRIQISYEESQALTACMAGKVVFLTCIKEVNQTNE